MSRRACTIGISLIALLLTSAFCGTPMGPPAMSETARVYLDQALDLMQKNSLNRSSIDWNKVRNETIVRAKNAQTTADTYPAIAYALAQLKEHHSFLQLPDSLSQAQKQVILADMMKVSGSSPESSNHRSPFSPSKEILGHIDRRGGKIIAHVIVPMCIPPFSDWEKNAPYFQQFADHLHETVVKLHAQNPDGWIIDLRGNGGGNMWPMLAGIGPVIGEGDLGIFESPSGGRVPWFYKEGKAGTRSPNGEETISAFVMKPPFVFPGLPRVAVLLDRNTASSGEAVAISLAGRAQERSFGEHTAGFSTSNNMHPLSDGASLFLCEGVEADRTGKRYPEGIQPDVTLPPPDARPSEDADLTLQAGEDWLVQQERGSEASRP